MKPVSLFAMVIAGLLANNAAAMDIIPSLTRLGTDAVAQNVSPTQFINDSFARKHAPLYRQLGLGLIDREEIQNKDKLAVARSVIAQILEGNLTDTYYSKTDIKPFLNVITHDFAKKHLAPNPFLACHKVRPISDSVAETLASLHLSDKSKKYLEKDATLDMLSSLVSRYADHPRVLEHVKASLLKAIETADIPKKLKKTFSREINAITPFEKLAKNELHISAAFGLTGIAYGLGAFLFSCGIAMSEMDEIPLPFLENLARINSFIPYYIYLPGLVIALAKEMITRSNFSFSVQYRHTLLFLIGYVGTVKLFDKGIQSLLDSSIA